MPANRKEYNRLWEQKNKDKRRAANKRWRAKQRQAFQDFKKGLKCEKCGEDHPACLEFHHPDPSVKEQSIANVAYRWSEARLKAEVAKCQVSCANCHRKVHFNDSMEG